MVRVAEGQRVLAAELALLERAPRQRCDLLPLILAERAVLECVLVNQANFDLVAMQLHRAGRLEVVELIHAEIAHPKLSHLAGLR